MIVWVNDQKHLKAFELIIRSLIIGIRASKDHSTSFELQIRQKYATIK
jgi:hypothetical protein